MIWFALSYMKDGEAELWVNTYIDKALENNDWGTWEEFLDKLAKDFSNAEEPRRALEELGKLQQERGWQQSTFSGSSSWQLLLEST
jgi:hypothetical protein